ncbi:GlcNAc-transferase family protein [Trinickia sp. YCB016]
MQDTIFVQMASYRDAELVPTLIDLIRQAAQPQRLRIVVCWQHAPEETLGAFWQQGFAKWRFETIDGRTVHFMEYYGAKIELIDVPHYQTQGACWARHLIQQHYRDERYTMQLDSHHRFVNAWDSLVIEMLESLRSKSSKPVLTAYLPRYSSLTEERSTGPLNCVFTSFMPDGVLVFKGTKFHNSEGLTEPIPARFYSGHFTFADGHFAEVIQHDPEYFFLGEEISITVRAFTHGYDLYHPYKTIGWHETVREGRPRVWEDHTLEAKNDGHIQLDWVDRNMRSTRRNRALFGMESDASPDIDIGKFGFGNERALAQYEAYAGVSFADRAVQRATLDRLPPSMNMLRIDAESEWRKSLLRSVDIRVCHHRDEFDHCALSPISKNTLHSAECARVTVYDVEDAVLHEAVLDVNHMLKRRSADWLDFHAIFETELAQLANHYILELLDACGAPLSRVKKQIEH